MVPMLMVSLSCSLNGPHPVKYAVRRHRAIRAVRASPPAIASIRGRGSEPVGTFAQPEEDPGACDSTVIPFGDTGTGHGMAQVRVTRRGEGEVFLVRVRATLTSSCGR
jgi:hypothetical protein